MTKSSKIQYKQTKELVRIALNHGMTQDEIGKLCRLGGAQVSQSQVSKWKNGHVLASQQQMQPLIEKFGHLLKREPFKLYHYVAESADRYIKVEGRTLLRERFLRKQPFSNNKFPSALRITVQFRKNGLLSYAIETTNAGSPQTNQIKDPAIAYWNDRFAVWTCIEFQDELHTENLLTSLDNYVAQNEVSKTYPTMAAMPFLIREALLKHSHQSGSIAEHL